MAAVSVLENGPRVHDSIDSKSTGKSAKVAITSHNSIPSRAWSFPQHIDQTRRNSSIMSISSILADPIQELDTRKNSSMVLDLGDLSIGNYTGTLQSLVPVARMVPLSEYESNDQNEDVNFDSNTLQDSHLTDNTQEWTPVNQPITRRPYMATELKRPLVTFVCQFCGQDYEQRMSLLAHIRKEHGPEMLQDEQSHNFDDCMGCDTVFSSEDHMLHHTCELQVEERVSAELEAQYFATAIAEIEAANVQATDNSTSLMCDICGRVFSSENDLLERACEHLIERLTSAPLSSTPLQGQEAQSDMEMDDLSDILEGSQQIPTAADGTNLLENQMMADVGIANKTTPVAAKRATLQSADGRFRCDLCRKKFRHQGTLGRHYRRVHSIDKPFTCTDCDEAFQTLRQRTLHHAMEHSGKKQFHCGECSLTFLQKFRMDLHHRVAHRGETLFTCEWCSRNFSYKAALLGHLKSCRPRHRATPIEG